MNLFTLFAKIVLQDDGIANKLKSIENQGKSTGNIVENSFEKIKSGALKVAGILGIGLGFKAATEGAYKMAESASDLNEAQNVVEQTFGKTAKSIEQWTTTTEKSAGISQTASTQWSGFMGAMLKSSGVSQTASASMSKNLVQLTGDMSSFYNVSTSDMWEKIRSGISGETEPLKQLGINMDVANLSAFALSEGIKKPYKEMSQGEQTTLRYNYLMSVTKDAQGDFGRTLSGSFANQVRVAQMNLADLGRNIGTVLLPYFMQGASWLNSNMPTIQKTVTSVVNSIINVAKNLAPTFSTWIKLITQIASSLLPSFGNSAKGASSAVKDLANGALKTVSSVLYTMRDHINAVKVVLATLTTVWGLHKAAVLASNVAQTVHNVITTAQGIKDKAETVYLYGLIAAEKARAIATKASAVAQGALNVVMNANPIALIIIGITALVTALVVLYNKNTTFRNFINGMWAGLKSIVSGAIEAIKGFFQGLGNKIESVGTWIKNTWNNIISFFGSLPGRFLGLVQGIGNAIRNGFNSAINFITSLPGKAIGWGKDFINGLINGIKSMIGGVVNAVSGVANKIRSFLHFSVPDEGSLTDYEQWMPDFMTGLADGISNNKYKVIDQIKNLANGMKIDTKATISNTNVGNSNKIESKQPVLWQVVLPNMKILAELLMDDIDTLKDQKFVLTTRRAGGV